ncbi:hypothetical protein CBS115989_7882 [Aspergillus niger]|nr:hypothetical protein CBS115989_7882 [Aspergillus niger]KAI2859447.1 hypothetical protein CBS11232_1908 [Aspergillus niger]KAI2872179.1 hypothetical protein CBS115988_8008 [Aspergillus niger]KAI3088055.1 hypothetical protein CBS147343_2187 [Aspergillus niger]
MFSEAIETATTDKVIAAPDPDHGVGYSSTSKHKDDAIVHAHRHVQPMPRQFNWISALGLGFSITNSWVGYLSCFGQNLAYGGAQACIFSLVAAFMVQVIVTLGLAELASAFPSSGGQYHFCYILSPDRTKRYSAFVVGWLSILAWWVVTYVSLPSFEPVRASLPSQWVTCGRIAWAFSRDNGLPFPEYFSQISKTFNFPVHTTIAAFLFTSLYGLLYLASTTAFNSIITSAVLFLNITYTVPQGILLSSGRSSMPKRYLNLGWAGYFCNGFAVVWIVIQGVLTCLPPDPEVTLGSMNYVCVILVGVFLVINLLWVAVGRKRFSGPDIDWGVVKTGQRE